jgi:hypothetical protein
MMIACLAVAACSLETGPPDNSNLPHGAPNSSLQLHSNSAFG